MAKVIDLEGTKRGKLLWLDHHGRQVQAPKRAEDGFILRFGANVGEVAIHEPVDVEVGEARPHLGMSSWRKATRIGSFMAST